MPNEIWSDILNLLANDGTNPVIFIAFYDYINRNWEIYVVAIAKNAKNK